jgi:hypothetical protein
VNGLPATVYELIAMGLRYWLVFLGVVIIWRAIRLMRKDQRIYWKTIRQLPDAGLVGELVALESGEAYPLPREGMIGSGRSSDIRIEGINRRALEFFFRAGYGLRLIPSHRRHSLRLDHEIIQPSGDYALHGSVLEIGGKAYRFRLFEGLDVPERQQFTPADGYSHDMYPDEADVWSHQMVMPSPPLTPPGSDGYAYYSEPAWPLPDAEEQPAQWQGYGMPPPEAGPADPVYWQPPEEWEGRDGY